MSGGGNVYITVEWLGGESETYTLDPSITGGHNTSWGWRVKVVEGVPFLIIRPKEGLRFELPIQNIKKIIVNGQERVGQLARDAADSFQPGTLRPAPDVAGGSDDATGRRRVVPAARRVDLDDVLTRLGVPVSGEPAAPGRAPSNGDRPVPRPSQRTTPVGTIDRGITYHYPDCRVADSGNCLCDFRDRHKE